MQIGNNGTKTYEYNTAQRPKDDNSYSSFVVDTKSVKENATLLTKDLIKFIDKSGGFSSLSKDDYDHCLLNKVVAIQKDNAKSLDYSATYWGHSFDGFNAILTNVEFHCKNITVTILQSHLFSSSYTSYAASVLGLRAPPIA